MAVTIMRQDLGASFHQTSSDSNLIGELSREDEPEVLEFLAVNPIHTVLMASFIRENGMISPRNRGSFYACRDRSGQLEGVALIGHVTVIETESEDSLSAFARLSRHCQNTRMVRGEREQINCFWRHYANSGQRPRLISSELLFEQRQPLPLPEPIQDLRAITLNELDQVLKINATLAFQEGGVSPMNTDPAGFRNRTARRIEQGRVWAWVRDGRVVFKADVVGETPQAMYLEGVYVDPEERLKGYGRRCMTQLGSILLQRSQAICLTINERNKNALAFYEKAGYQFHSNYVTIYLQP